MSPLLGAVLLAGGASRRFGAANKLLAEIDGIPIIAKVAGAIVAGGVLDLVVVTGAEHDRYAAALAGVPVRLVYNPAWDEGIGSSIAAGVVALSEAAHGTFVVPGDLPNLTPSVYRKLGDVFARTGGGRVVVPISGGGAQRNPVLWPRRFFPDLEALSGTKGGKSLLDSLGEERVDVTFDDESLFADIDTTDDYARFVAGD